VNFFATNLKYLREKRGLKQYEAAAQLGFEQSTYNGYENEKSRPYLDGIIRISEFFQVGETELLHTDLTKQGEYSNKKSGSQKSQKDEYNSENKGEFSPKKYLKNEKLSSVNEGEHIDAIIYRMPQVVTVDSQGNENVILIQCKARAGYLNGYSDPSFIEKLPAYRLPGLNNGSYRLFEVDGLSMYPTLHGGDLIIGQNVEQLQDVRDDRIHVVVTKNEGVVVKRVLNRISKDGKLILKSDNHKDRDMYPPIICDPGDVLEIWYAIGFISRQMRPPAEVYNRVVDVDGRLTLLEDLVKKKLNEKEQK
jgi:transcriptional regulator with XRE-family HTH domain/signal peptidase I